MVSTGMERATMIDDKGIGGNFWSDSNILYLHGGDVYNRIHWSKLIDTYKG